MFLAAIGYKKNYFCCALAVETIPQCKPQCDLHVALSEEFLTVRDNGCIELLLQQLLFSE